MGRLVLMEFLTLDGVSQGPGAPDEDTSDGFTRGGWLVPHMDESFAEVVADWVDHADAFLFGRPGRELQIHGSARLAQSLLAAGSTSSAS